jgi:hypothetical protein
MSMMRRRRVRVTKGSMTRWLRLIQLPPVLPGRLMKSKEALTMKTLETKLLITKKKKEVKLAMVEARREDAKVKAELELRMIALKEAKAMKEIMMMHTDDMDEDRLAWWKETKVDIMARKMFARQARVASAVGVSTPQGESPTSGGGAGDGLIDG